MSSNSNSVASKFKYQGQELEESLGLDMYEFELRQYDPAIGRFMTTDPYEQFHSPYVAMGNNPIVAFDPDGGLCYDSNGNAIACPEDSIYDEYRDNNENHINILDEVVITPEPKEAEESNSNSETDLVKIENDSSNTELAQTLAAAAVVSQLDSPAPGPGDILALLILGKYLIDTTNPISTIGLYHEPNLVDKAEDSSKNERHGDGGRSQGKAEKQIAELEAQLATATGKEAKKIKQKIQNVKRNAAKNKKGETHSRNAKGN